MKRNGTQTRRTVVNGRQVEVLPEGTLYDIAELKPGRPATFITAGGQMMMTSIIKRCYIAGSHVSVETNNSVYRIANAS